MYYRYYVDKTIGYEFIEQFVSHKGKSFEKS